jgi:hypothetical protein
MDVLAPLARLATQLSPSPGSALGYLASPTT